MRLKRYIAKELQLLFFTGAMLFGFFQSTHANHLAGGNFEISCAGPNNYEIRLTLFRDCSSTTTLPNNLQIQLNSPCGNINRTLTRNSNLIENISQVCPAQINNTTCDGGPLPGMEQHVYVSNVNIPPCDFWTLSYSVCCRNPSNNLDNPTNDDFEITATFDNTTPCPNLNTPVFGYAGIPYVCSDETVNFNPSVTDPDGDSLFYSLVPPASTNWAPGFSSTQPFGPGVPVAFDQFSGQLTFTPDAGMTTPPATWSLAIQVCKIRNGDTLTCVTRDFQFVVQNCNNSSPYLVPPGIVNLSPGVVLIDSNSIEVCGQGINNFSFDIFFDDSLVTGQTAGDQITVTSNIDTAFPNANITINNGNPASISFSQTTNIGAPGTRYFTVHVEDDACPIPGFNTYQFDVTILPTVHASSNDDTLCSGQDTAFVSIFGDSNYTWSVISGDPFNFGVNFSDTTGTLADSVWMRPSQTTVYRVENDMSSSVCTTSDTVTISVSNIPQGGLLINDTTICDYDSLAIGSAGPIPGHIYMWNTGDSTSTITAYPNNTYQITVIDTLLGCQVADTVVIDGYIPTPHGLIEDSSLCAGDTLFLTPGTDFAQHLWSTGHTSDTLAADTSGTYRVTSTDTNGCEFSDTVTLYFSEGPQFALRSDTALCENDQITLDPGAGFDSYLWSTNETTETIIAENDTYWVEITDTIGCSNSDTVVISVRTAPQAELSNLPVLCVNDSAQIGPQNDIFPQYQWNTGDSVAYIMGYPNNEYQLTVTDSFGCQFADTLFVNAYADPNHALPEDTAFCYGDSLILSPGAGFADYQWSTGAVTASITVDTTDTYYVTSTDTNGCVYVDSIDILVHQEIPFALPDLNDTTICSYDSILVDLSYPGYSDFVWGNSGDTVTAQYSGPVETPIDAIDTNGCVLTGNILVINEPQLPLPLPSVTQVCPGDSSEITAHPVYDSYLWGNNETTQTIKVLGAGTYFLTATDSLGCDYEVFIDAFNHVVDTVDLGEDDTLCIGQTKLLNAGANYSIYNWDDTTTNPVRIVDSTGTYNVEVFDVNGCSSRDTIYVHFSEGPDFTLGNDTALCPEDDIRLEPGTGLDPYLWNTGETTESIFAQDGTFWVEATDSVGCPARDTIVLSVRTSPTPDIGPDIHYCRHTTFNELANPGAGYQSYLWHNASTTQIVTVTEADSTVWVEVTDNWGCVGSDTLFVIEDPLPNVDLGGGDTVCAQSIKSLNAGTSGGTIVDYQWSYNNATTQTVNIQAPGNITGPVTNYHSVTVTDHNGCMRADTFELVTVPLPIPDLGNDTAFCTGDPFSMTLDPGNFDSYQWNTGSTNPTIQIGPVDSLYSVQVTDVNGCTASDNIAVTENSLPNPVLPPDTSICSGIPFNFVLTPGGFVSYQWSTGTQTSSILVTSGGNYEVTVTDVNGCENDTNMEITIEPSPDPDLGNDIVVCEDSVFLFTLDGTTSQIGPAFTYNWSTGASSDSIDVTSIGSYSITVTNQDNGCRDSSRINIIGFEKLNPQLGIEGEKDVICDGEAKLLDPMVDGSGYSYTWSTGESTRRILVDQPGTYWVELNAINGTCGNIRDTITYEQGTTPVVELGEDIKACEGQTVRLLDNHSPFPNAEYVWQDSIRGSRLEVKKSGIYRVRVINQCGTATDEIQVHFDDCYQIYVPNAFTPNGDGKNDVFKAETDQPVVDFALVIYNRWGRAVFKTNDINVGWDGTRNGGELPQDVYVYRISYVSALDPRRERRTRTGTVTLIKGENVDF